VALKDRRARRWCPWRERSLGAGVGLREGAAEGLRGLYGGIALTASGASSPPATARPSKWA